MRSSRLCLVFDKTRYFLHQTLSHANLQSQLSNRFNIWRRADNWTHWWHFGHFPHTFLLWWGTLDGWILEVESPYNWIWFLYVGFLKFLLPFENPYFKDFKWTFESEISWRNILSSLPFSSQLKLEQTSIGNKGSGSGGKIYMKTRRSKNGEHHSWKRRKTVMDSK